MDLRQRMREQGRARAFFASLTSLERGEIGDELVLGDLDVDRWFGGERQSDAFMRALDDARILWEMEAAI